MVDDLIIGMAGAGGDGIVSAGESLISAAAAEGYFAILTKSFGSQIRGGESSCRLRVSTRPVLNPGGTLDVAVVLNWEDFLKFGGELPVGPATVVIYEAKTGVEPAKIPLAGPGARRGPRRADGRHGDEGGGHAAGQEQRGAGACSPAGSGSPAESLLKGIRKKFARKGEAVLQGNERAFAAGLEYAEQHPLGHWPGASARRRAAAAASC